MPPNPLDVLKLGLAEAQKQAQQKRTSLLERAQRGELTPAEETWLDREGNLVDEVAVLDILERAGDYETAYKSLSEQQRGIVERLKALGRKGALPGNKRKRPAKKPRPEPDPEPEQPIASASTATFTHKENATLAQRIEILDWHHQSTPKSQVRTAAHWDKIYPNLRLKQPAISSWLKDEDKWRLQWAEAQSRGHAKTKRAKQSLFPEVNDMVELWVARAMREGVKVGGEALRQAWIRFADLDGVQEEERLSLSSGWLEAMKKRCGLVGYKLRGEGAAAPTCENDVEAERARVRAVVARYNYPLKNIFSMDEMALFYGLPIPHTRHLTIALTTNADGSEKLPPLIIGTRTHEKSVQLGFYYRNNAAAWMTPSFYQEWLKSWDERLQKEGRHVLLLQDDSGVHRPPELTNIRVEVSGVTPSVVRAFKARYRALFVHRAVDRFDVGIDPGRIFDIELLEAMRLVEAAWGGVNKEGIHNTWKRSGILPGFPAPAPPPPPLYPHEPQTSTAINWYDDVNQLEAIRIAAAAWQEVDATNMRGTNQWGAIPPLPQPLPLPPPPQDPETADLAHTIEVLAHRLHAPPLPLEDLINSPLERDIMRGTDEDIYRAVKAHEGNEREVGEAGPTRREALEASFVLRRFLLDEGAPWARGVERGLFEFGRLSRVIEPPTPPAVAKDNATPPRRESPKITQDFPRQA